MLNVESTSYEKLNKIYDMKNRKMNDENKSMSWKIYQKLRESFVKNLLFINFYIFFEYAKENTCWKIAYEIMNINKESDSWILKNSC